MYKALAAILLSLLAVPAQGLAQTASEMPEPPLQLAAVRSTGGKAVDRPLQTAALREAARLGLRLGSAELQPDQQEEDRNWIGRHPSLFGALAGAGTGAVSSIPRSTELYCATGGDEDCLFHGGPGVLFGAGAGAGVGALVGFLIGLSR